MNLKKFPRLCFVLMRSAVVQTIYIYCSPYTYNNTYIHMQIIISYGNTLLDPIIRSTSEENYVLSTIRNYKKDNNKNACY